MPGTGSHALPAGPRAPNVSAGQTGQQTDRDVAGNAPLKGKTYLLGVGAQKAGTTWLYEYLWDHPQVAMSPVKEMHFWGYRDCDPWKWPVTHFRRKLRRRQELDAKAGVERDYAPLRERIRMAGDLALYRRFFRRQIRDGHTVFGEITPAYCHLPPEEFAFINRQFAQVKVIYLLRNPADRHWSQMRFSEGAEAVEELEAAIDRTLANPKYAERNNYDRTLANLARAFRPEQVHIDFYETLFTPQAVTRLCTFLGIADRPADFTRTANVSVKMPLAPARRATIVRALRDQYVAVDDHFDGQIPQSWHDDMQAWL